MQQFKIVVATDTHLNFANLICEMYAASAKVRGTGIALRTTEYIESKIHERKAIIALDKEGKKLAGFCYIETWGDKNYVANSGLIVAEEFRKQGLAKLIKQKAFELSKKRYPDAKLFGLTTSLAVMKINSDLGYRPVTFSELTDDDKFWQGCQSCVNYDVLTRTERKHCLCTGMLHDPKEKRTNLGKKFQEMKTKYDRWLRIRREILLKRFKKEIKVTREQNLKQRFSLKTLKVRL